MHVRIDFVISIFQRQWDESRYVDLMCNAKFNDNN